MTAEDEPSLEAVGTVEIEAREKRVVITFGLLADAQDLDVEDLARRRHNECWLYLHDRFSWQVVAAPGFCMLAVNIFGLN